MRLYTALLLGAVALGAQAQALAPEAPAITGAGTVVRRQDGGTPPDETTAPPAESSSGGDDGDDGGNGDNGNSDEETSSSEDPSSSSGGGDEEDTTVFQTTTVTDGDADTITSRTTVQRTSTFTVVVVSTIFSTSTVTEEGDTATKTIWETSTVRKNGKRDLGLRTLPIVEAQATAVEAVPTVTSVDYNNLEMARHRRNNVFDKRATVTEVRTVTVGDNSETTVVDTITRTVVSTTSTVTRTTNVVTETEIEDAATTETVTSTLTVTSTGVNTDSVQTTTGSSSGDDNNSDGNSSSGSSDDGGLSTGAKAGIGAGVGVGVLLILGALAFFCIRRRRRGPKADPDGLAGASEVPVGGPVGSTPPMSHQTSTHHAAAAGLLSPHGRAQPTKPSPEGYRGTAMGDGRAGYAKPAPYGSAYAQQPASTSPTNRSSTLNSTSPFSPNSGTVSSMGADSLPAHPAPGDHQHVGAAELGNDSSAASRWQPSGGATEMDAAGVGHQSSAPPRGDVYEMPAQNYR